MHIPFSFAQGSETSDDPLTLAHGHFDTRTSWPSGSHSRKVATISCKVDGGAKTDYLVAPGGPKSAGTMTTAAEINDRPCLRQGLIRRLVSY